MNNLSRLKIASILFVVNLAIMDVRGDFLMRVCNVHRKMCCHYDHSKPPFCEPSKSPSIGFLEELTLVGGEPLLLQFLLNAFG